MKQKGTTTCPRCESSMTCMPEAIRKCPCNNIVLSSALQSFLSTTNYPCLCNSCLEDLEEIVLKSAREDMPLRPDKLIEGIHFYIDKGQYVFTEYYHIRRGHCCENNCRHCAYGYKLKLEKPV